MTFHLCLRQELDPVLPSHGAVASRVARNKRNKHSQGVPVGSGLWRVGKAETKYIHKEVASEMGLAGACARVQSVEILSMLQRAGSGLHWKSMNSHD